MVAAARAAGWLLPDTRFAEVAQPFLLAREHPHNIPLRLAPLPDTPPACAYTRPQDALA